MSMTAALALLATFVVAHAAHAQTAFERLFDPRSTLSVVLEMSQASWNQMAAEQPVGGPCNFAQSPTIDRYNWHTSNITLITEWETTQAQQTYVNAGVKKKSFCGSLDNVKPSLTINLSKFQNNDALAENQLGTTHLSLENSKQDGDLFHQCAGYYAFRSMDIPAPMCTFAAVYRRTGTASPVFLGLYVLTEAVKKDFFLRRPGVDNVPQGSLYEFEAPDDFTQATLSQLQVEWSGTSNQDFVFAVNQVQNQPATALSKILDLPPFITYWTTEIFLKSGDGFLSNRNNVFAFEGPPPPGTIQRTRFRFIPHGLDQILASNTKPSVSNNSVLAQLALKDNGLRYQLIGALSSMGDHMEAADVSGHVNSFVPLVLRLWRGTDAFFGADPNKAMQMAENVRLAAQQAIVDVQTVFGNGLTTLPLTTTRIVSPFFNQCATRVSLSNEIGRASCASLPGQQWTFESKPQSMGSSGFTQPLKLYRVRNQSTTDCLTSGAQFTDGSDRYKLVVAACSLQTAEQRFFLNQREGRALEIRSFARNSCIHFSSSAVTNDGRPAIYLGPCIGEAKALVVVE
jgi:hypothetical protein